MGTGNNFTCGEHTGTHFDAPAHWISGKDHANNTVDTIDSRNFLAPAAVVDASAEVARERGLVADGRVPRGLGGEERPNPAGALVAFRTDWSKRISDPASYVNMKKEDGAHTPGPDTGCGRIPGRANVHGFAVETINTDAGQSYAWPVAYPCHTLMHGAAEFGLQCLKNLDQLPVTGAMIVSAPLKIKGGLGSPLRVLALIPS